MDVTQWVAVAIGVAIFLALFWFLVRFPNPTVFQYTMLRIMLAMGCACLAVILTGFLRVDFKVGIQAGGALAVFVIVYFRPPASLPSPLGTDPDSDRLHQDWKEVRDVKLPDGNMDDIVRALNLLNRTAELLLKRGDLVSGFKQAHGEEYCALYNKLRTGGVIVPTTNVTTAESLNEQTRHLATKLGCDQ